MSSHPFKSNVPQNNMLYNIDIYNTIVCIVGNRWVFNDAYTKPWILDNYDIRIMDYWDINRMRIKYEYLKISLNTCISVQV